jgi:hypothetical protein
VCLILCDLESSKRGGLGLIWAVAPQRKKKVYAPLYYQILTFFMLQQPKSGKACLIFEVFRSHSGRHTQPLGLLRTRDQLVTEASCAQHNKHKRRTSMPSGEFEPAIPGIEWSQTCAVYRTTIRSTRVFNWDPLFRCSCTNTKLVEIHSVLIRPSTPEDVLPLLRSQSFKS